MIGFLGHTEHIVGTKAVALRQGEQLLMTGTSGYTTLNSRHLFILLSRSGSDGKHALDVELIALRNRHHAAQVTLVLGRAMGQDVTLGRVAKLEEPPERTLKRLAAAAWFSSSAICRFLFIDDSKAPSGKSLDGLELPLNHFF